MIPDLRFFQPDEFTRGGSPGGGSDGHPVAWADLGLMSPRLLVLLDLFRWRLLTEGLAHGVEVSPASGAVGRRLGPDASSQHNVDRWGEVRAIDVLPRWGAQDHRQATETLHKAMEVGVECGFTGVGVYPHWRPRPGLHVDVRQDRQPGDPATWGAVLKDGRQFYVGVDEALASVG